MQSRDTRKVPHTVVVPMVYGDVLMNRYDKDRADVVFRTGYAFDHGEIECVAPFVEPGSITVDAGAYFGFWTLAMARRAAAVYSFEAQREVYNCLCGTLALNGIETVFPSNIALGKSSGTIKVPRFDYDRELEFGCVYLCPKTVHGELSQTPRGFEEVPLKTLDSFGLSNVSLMKIDVEGMEWDVMQGACETIRRNRPVVYVETIHGHKTEMLSEFKELGYNVLSNPGNLLAIPIEKYSRYRSHLETVFNLSGKV